jgi:uncharacterized membrane protein YqhA
MLIRMVTACRFLMVIPVIGCLILTAGVVVMGFARIITGGIEVIEKGDASPKAAKIMSLNVIETIDLFLIGAIAYIAAVGIYKLFIADPETRLRVPIRLTINSLKDLEDKIIGVIVAALSVAFLGHAAGGDTPDALLSYGGGIAAVVVALAFFMNYGQGKKQEKS